MVIIKVQIKSEKNAELLALTNVYIGSSVLPVGSVHRQGPTS